MFCFFAIAIGDVNHDSEVLRREPLCVAAGSKVNGFFTIEAPTLLMTPLESATFQTEPQLNLSTCLQDFDFTEAPTPFRSVSQRCS